MFSQHPLHVEEQELEQELPQPLHDDSHDPVQLFSQAPQQPLQYGSSVLFADNLTGKIVPKATIPNIGRDLINVFLKN